MIEGIKNKDFKYMVCEISVNIWCEKINYCIKSGAMLY